MLYDKKLCVKKDRLGDKVTSSKYNGKCSQWQVGKASANNVPEGSGDVPGRRRQTYQDCTGLGRVELVCLVEEVKTTIKSAYRNHQ